MKKKVFIIVIAIVVVAVSGLFYLLGSASKQTEYELGSDKVASINAVIGEVRKVKGVIVDSSSKMQTKQYTYESASVEKDLSAYFSYLTKNGWDITKTSSSSIGNREMQFTTESVDAGKILIMTVMYEEGKYVIRISKLAGTYTRNKPQ